jgi:RNA polymerase sigma-70 factor, ECF subfamily
MADTGGGGASIEELEQLYRSRYPRFLRVAIATVGSRELAAEVVQEAFVRALRSRHTFRAEGSLEAWVWRIVTNVALTQSRNVRKQYAQELDVAVESSTNGISTTLPELRAAMALLPERQRQAIFLRHYAGLSYEEIADVLGIATGTVSATLHAARDALRLAVEERA